MARLTAKREWLARTALVIGAALLMLVVLEGILWLFNVAPSSAGDAHDPWVDRFDPATVQRALDQSPPESRVLCLGGSTMAGTPLDYQISMCNFAADALGAVPVNLAVGGQNSLGVRRRAELACQQKHQLVLLITGHNEFVTLRRFSKDASPTAQFAAKFLGRFRFFRWFGSFSDEPKATEIMIDFRDPVVGPSVVVDAFRENFEAILVACSHQPLVVATPISNPDYQTVRPGTSIRKQLATADPSDILCAYCDRAPPEILPIVRQATAAANVPLVETETLLKNLTTLEAFWDRLHPKPEVHRRLAITMLQEAKASYDLSASGA
ncbi:MAG: hypothetical protein ACI9OJ_005215 [Myxococcota bacterium]